MSSPSFPNPSHRPVSLALLLCAVVLMAANLRSPLVALGPVVPFIQDDLGVSASYIGLIAAAPMAVFALFSPLAVWAAKKWGMAQVLPWSMALMMAGIGLRITGPSVDFLLLGTIVLSAAIAAGNVLLPALAKRNLPTRIYPLPVEMPPLDVFLYWHGNVDTDPANAWLRELLIPLFAAAEEV